MSMGLRFALKGFREFATWYDATVGDQVDAVIRTLDDNSGVNERTRQLAKLWGLNAVATAYARAELVEAVTVLSEKPGTTATARIANIDKFISGLDIDGSGPFKVRLASPLVATLPNKPDIPITDVSINFEPADATTMTLSITAGPALIAYETSLTFTNQEGNSDTTPPVPVTFQLVV